MSTGPSDPPESPGGPQDRSYWRRPVPTPRSTQALLATRLLAASGSITAGVLTYPTGRTDGDSAAVPLALVIVGVMLLLHAGLDRIFFKIVRYPSAQKLPAITNGPGEGYRVLAGALVATPATVLGLVAAFTVTMTDALRVGAVCLVAAIIIGLLLSSYLVFEPPTVGALGFLSWFLSVLIAVIGFGLACIGLAVAYR